MAETKRTVPALANYLAKISGQPSSVMRHIARRLREAGHLSQAGHGRGAAEATSMDAATLLLVSMCRPPAVDAPRFADLLKSLRRMRKGKGSPASRVMLKPRRLPGLKSEAIDPVGLIADALDAQRSENPRFIGFHTLDVEFAFIVRVEVNWCAESRDYWKDSGIQDWYMVGEFNKNPIAREFLSRSPSLEDVATPFDTRTRVGGVILEYLAHWLGPLAND